MTLPETQTPDIASLTPGTKAMLHNPSPIWGKLIPTIRCLQGFDLINRQFLFGRAEECSVIISQKNFTKKRLTNFSKVHFKIEHGEDAIVTITDHSKNGTFVNGELIGKEKSCILQNDDEIAVSFKSLRVYVFKNMINSNQAFLPVGLRKKYEVSKVLGQGGCGEVRLVYDKFSMKPYACKRVMKSVNGSKTLNKPEKIENEIDILKRLTHPCVISMKEIEQSADAYFIVMEYMPGGELTHLIFSPKPLNEAQIKYFFYQLAVGVQYLHSHNITHRDLKPENILLSNDSKDHNLIKISDFGLSKIVKEESVMKTLCGTPTYAAPEILDSAVTAYDQKVDVWSLGVIFYFMITQEFPFRGATTLSVTRQILKGKYSMEQKVWLQISQDAKNLLRKMLIKDPVKRIDIHDIVDHPWFGKDIEIQRKVNSMLYTNFETRQLESSSSDECDTTLQPAKRIRLSEESSD